MPAAAIEHALDRSRCDVKEASEVHGDHGVEVLEGVVGEGLADIDPGVVDQRVDPPEARHRLLDDAFGRVRVSDVTLDGDNPGVLRRGDGSGGRDHRVAQLTVCLGEACADALGGTGDDRDLRVLDCGRLRHARSSASWITPVKGTLAEGWRLFWGRRAKELPA